MRQRSIIILIFILMVISFFSAADSIAIDRFLRTEEASDADVKGQFTLILYGGI